MRKPSRLILIAGLSITIVSGVGMSYAFERTTEPAKTVQQATDQSVAAKTTTSDETKPAADTSSNSAAASTAASASDKPASSQQAASAAKPAEGGIKATSTTNSSQRTPLPAPVSVAQSTAPTRITSASLSAPTDAGGGCGVRAFSYSYSAELSYGQAATFFAEWEYERTDGGVLTFTVPTVLNGYKVSAGSTRLMDTISADRGFQTQNGYSYRIRMHFTSPNEAYSNWVTVPATVFC